MSTDVYNHQTNAQASTEENLISLPIKPTDFTKQASFSPMLQGPGTNKLSQISTRSNLPEVDAITGEATISQDDFKVFIEKFNKLKDRIRVSTHKLLDFFVLSLTRQNNYRSSGELHTNVSIPLDDYLIACGKPLTKSSKDEMRKRIKADLETLYKVSLEWKEKSGKHTRDYIKMRLLTSHGIKNGHIVVGFSPEITHYLANSYVMQYPLGLLRVSERNPSTYHIGRKLLQHNSINNNHRKGTANIISVKALLASCPDIPMHEEVKASDRALDRRIKTPFENALNALPFISWEYANSKGVPLTDVQLQNNTYASFITLFIRFSVTNSPDKTARLAAKYDKATDKAKKKKKPPSS